MNRTGGLGGRPEPSMSLVGGGHHADALEAPHRWAGERAPSWSTDCRLSLMSLALSGSASRMVSRAAIARPPPRGGRCQRRLTLLPVARAQLVGLQRVEHTQRLVHV